MRLWGNGRIAKGRAKLAPQNFLNLYHTKSPGPVGEIFLYSSHKVTSNLRFADIKIEDSSCNIYIA